MSTYELSPDEQRATLDRYFEPVTEAQRVEIARVWNEVCAGSMAYLLNVAFGEIWEARNKVSVSPASMAGFGDAWLEEVQAHTSPTAQQFFCWAVRRFQLARGKPSHPGWAAGLWQWVERRPYHKPVQDLRGQAGRYWHLDPAGPVRAVGDPKVDRLRWMTWEIEVPEAVRLSMSVAAQLLVIDESQRAWLDLRYWPVKTRTADRLEVADLSTAAVDSYVLERQPAHVAIVPGAPRSEYEVDYYIAGSRCHACEARGLGRSVPTYAQGVVAGFCAGCKAERQFRFTPVAASGPIEAFHLAAGTAPSTVYDAAELRALVDEALGEVSRTPGDYGTVAEYTAARRRLVRGYTALVELAKFLPGDREVAEEVATVDALYTTYEAAQKTVASRPGAQPAARSIDDRLRQHRAWLARGGVGDGRLTMIDEVWQGQGFDYARWARARMVGTRFERMALSHADLTDAELERTQFVACRLGWSTWARARLTECDLRESRLSLAELEGLEARGGDWRGIVAGRSRWRGDLRGLDLRDASLTDSRFTDLYVERCDLRGADLGRVDYALSLGTLERVRFVDCDLRGAKLDGAVLKAVRFERCKLAGIEGTPDVRHGTEALDCDLSPDGDGGLGGGDQLLALWKARGTR
ncbi:MAG: pentapeptide repeat-containing protein [Kofleriaceae bacterium]|nr:pentapeptide repeat-containing protein [Kofleriaceae bacterium]MBP9167295.1 pentapeptide repeat-containing protein [Kofleriaceae bacterium]